MNECRFTSDELQNPPLEEKLIGTLMGKIYANLLELAFNTEVDTILRRKEILDHMEYLDAFVGYNSNTVNDDRLLEYIRQYNNEFFQYALGMFQRRMREHNPNFTYYKLFQSRSIPKEFNIHLFFTDYTIDDMINIIKKLK